MRSLIVVPTILYIILGCSIGGFGMILIAVPVFLPVLMQYRYDPIWFGVMLMIVIELGRSIRMSAWASLPFGLR